MVRQLLVFVTFVLLFAVPAGLAQGLVEPARGHVGEKARAATSDPAAFAKDHTQPDAWEREANWTVAYSCFVVDRANEEAGTPRPPLEPCDDYEEVLGIAPENHSEPASDVQNLTQEPVAEVVNLTDDAARTLERIVDEPASALDEARSFVERAGAAVGRILDHVVGTLILALQTGAGAAMVVVMQLFTLVDGVGVAIGATFDASQGLVDAIVAAASTLAASASATGSGIHGLVDAVAGGIQAGVGGLVSIVAKGATAVGAVVGAAGAAVAEAAAQAGQAVDDAADAVGDFVGRLFDGGSRSDDDAAPLGSEVGDVGEDAADALPCLSCLLE